MPVVAVAALVVEQGVLLVAVVGMVVFGQVWAVLGAMPRPILAAAAVVRGQTTHPAHWMAAMAVPA